MVLQRNLSSKTRIKQKKSDAHFFNITVTVVNNNNDFDITVLITGTLSNSLLSESNIYLSVCFL